MGRSGSCTGHVSASWFSWPSAVHHLSVLPDGNASDHAAGVAVLYFYRAQSRLSAHDQARYVDRLRLSRHAEPESVSEEQDTAATALAEAGVSRRARPPTDLCGVWHVD